MPGRGCNRLQFLHPAMKPKIQEAGHHAPRFLIRQAGTDLRQLACMGFCIGGVKYSAAKHGKLGAYTSARAIRRIPPITSARSVANASKINTSPYRSQIS